MRIKRWCIAITIAAVAALSGAIPVAANAATAHPAVHSSAMRPADVGPYAWPQASTSGSLCITAGTYDGDNPTMYQCDEAAYWTVGTWSGLTGGASEWNGDNYLYIENSGTKYCIDDPGGEDNIQAVMEVCAAVGGQSFTPFPVEVADPPYWAWVNAYVSKSNTQEAVTDDYNGQSNGDWVVFQTWTGEGANIENQQQWSGPGDWG